MRIDHLAIRNFNGFERFEIDFDPQFNLLAGDNASGKTSVLDALTVLLESWVRGIQGDGTGGGISPAYIRIVEHTHEDSHSFERQLPVRLEASGQVVGEAISWARQRNREKGGTTSAEARNIAEAAMRAARSVRENASIVLPLICSYGAERLWYESPKRAKVHGKGAKEGKHSRLDGYENCLDFGIRETVFSEWMRAQVLDSFQLGKKTKALQVTEKAITACVDGAKALVYSEREKELAVFIEPFGWQLMPNLSHGQRLMVTMIGELVRLATGLNPQLGDSVLDQTPGIVLIDELDLHLHPKWQRRIIHDLKSTFPSIQFITTTHSPQLIGEAKPHEVRILEDGKAYSPPYSYGLDSSRVLGEIQGAAERNAEVGSLIHRVSEEIDGEHFDEARKLLHQLEEQVGENDAEITRARSLIDFMEAPL